MTNPGPPTVTARLVAGGLAVLALGVGFFWMWSMAQGVLFAGVPSWVIGLVVVGLLVALAMAVDRVRHGAS